MYQSNHGIPEEEWDVPSFRYPSCCSQLKGSLHYLLFVVINTREVCKISYFLIFCCEDPSTNSNSFSTCLFSACCDVQAVVVAGTEKREGIPIPSVRRSFAYALFFRFGSFSIENWGRPCLLFTISLQVSPWSGFGNTGVVAIWGNLLWDSKHRVMVL